MTTEEANSLVSGALVVVNGEAQPVMFAGVRLDGNVSVIGTVHLGARIRAITPGQLHLASTSRTLALTNITPTQSAALQQAAFKLGYGWGSGRSQNVSYVDRGSLLIPFGEEKRFYYNPEAENSSYFYLNCSFQLEYNAALWCLNGGPASIENLLCEDILILMNNAPTNPMLRGLIRSKTGKAVPHEVMANGAAAIKDWLNTALGIKQPHPELPLAQPAPHPDESFAPPVADQLAEPPF